MSRTTLQTKADAADCALFSVIGSVEVLREMIRKRQPAEAAKLTEALGNLRGARTALRMLMHREDRERTRGY